MHQITGTASGSSYRDYGEPPSDGQFEEAEQWEREEQQVCGAADKVSDVQVLIRRQDDTLGVISGTLNTIASQAGLIGQEVVEHSECVSGWTEPVGASNSSQNVGRPVQPCGWHTVEVVQSHQNNAELHH